MNKPNSKTNKSPEKLSQDELVFLIKNKAKEIMNLYSKFDKNYWIKNDKLVKKYNKYYKNFVSKKTDKKEGFLNGYNINEY